MSDNAVLCSECFFFFSPSRAPALEFALCGITRVCNLLRSDCSFAISALFVLTSITAWLWRLQEYLQHPTAVVSGTTGWMTKTCFLLGFHFPACLLQLLCFIWFDDGVLFLVCLWLRYSKDSLECVTVILSFLSISTFDLFPVHCRVDEKLDFNLLQFAWESDGCIFFFLKSNYVWKKYSVPTCVRMSGVLLLFKMVNDFFFLVILLLNWMES